MQLATPPTPAVQSCLTSQAPVLPKQNLLPFALVTALFFLWGMSNNLTDILVQQFKKALELSPLEAQLVQTAVFLGYFFMAIPAATLTRRRGYKSGVLLGLCLFGGGMLLFWPAAIIGRYPWLLSALFIVGCGSATLETAANPYIAQAGANETSERRLNFAQSFNPPGTITGVLVGTFFIFSGVELPAARIATMKADGTYASYLHGELMRVVPTYVILGCVVLALAVVLRNTSFASSDGLIEKPGDGEPMYKELFTLLRTPQVLTAVIAQFCYCGAQIATWSAFIPYLKQYTATTERAAGLFLTGNLIAFALGRLLSTVLMRWFRPARMVALYAVANVALLMVGILRPGPTGAIAIMATSFFMSIMFPTIFALGIKGLGARTKFASSLLVMAVIGGAVVPPLLGFIARSRSSYAAGYSVVGACYLAVALYGGFYRDRDDLLDPLAEAMP